MISAVTFKFGIKRFDNLWSKNVEEFSSSLNRPDILAKVEEELALGAIQYPNVVFTPNYMITFKSFGDIFCVRDIDLLDIDILEPTSHDIMWGAKTRYYFNCIAGPRLAFLSDNEDHIRELFLEIRRRHPDVELTPRAQEYFFPTTVSAE